MYRGGVIEHRSLPTQPGHAERIAGQHAAAFHRAFALRARGIVARGPEPGWWESMIGAGKPIDTNRFYVLCINSIGSPYGSSSPTSIDRARAGRLA